MAAVILVVDEDPGPAEALQSQLAGDDWDVVALASARESVDIALERNPALIVLSAASRTVSPRATGSRPTSC